MTEREKKAIDEMRIVVFSFFPFSSHPSRPPPFKKKKNAQTIFTTRPELARALGLGAFCGKNSASISSLQDPPLQLHHSRPPRVRPRLARMSPAATRVRSLRAPAIGRLVSVTGTVVRASGVRPLPTAVSFECAACGSVTRVPLDAGRWPGAPRACGGGKEGGSCCRGKRFFPDLSSAETVDWQRLRLQDLPIDDGDVGANGGGGGGGGARETGNEGNGEEEEEDAPGAAPAAIDVDVSGDLVASCAPGDVVTVVGLVRVCAASSSSSSANAANTSKAGLYVAYLDAVSVEQANKAPVSPPPPPLVGAADPLGLLPGGAAPDEEASFFGQEQEAEQEGDAPSGAASFSRRDLAFVVKFISEVGRSSSASGGGAFRHLVHALAPGVYGHEMVKAALVLALFGGVGSENKKKNGMVDKKKKKTKKKRNKEKSGEDDDDDESSDGDDDDDSGDIAADTLTTAPRRRSEIHVLLCGDPGLGKSQLLKAAAAAAPRGVFVCGAAGSAAGLTASVGRDPSTGHATLEAGALALADRGTCCVDEFDKLAADPGALLGALEQQEVAVAKAGVLARLPARASLLAAANPAGGSHDPSRSLAENVALPRALLSRFDLVLVVLDTSSPAWDRAVSDFILGQVCARAPSLLRAADAEAV